jgi:hypothetical protein
MATTLRDEHFSWHNHNDRRTVDVGSEQHMAMERVLRKTFQLIRADGAQKQNVVRMPKKKTMSAAARRKIAAAQRARWAKVKAARK